MHDANDMDLLRQFAAQNSDSAFATLVERHVNLVYSAALRKTGNPHSAEEITQAVFIILAQKAGRIPNKTILPGWLYQTARLTAASFLKREIRRVRREQEAYMQTEFHSTASDETWRQLAPLLDDAMGQLGEKDRAAVVLRFFGGKSFAEVGAAAGVSENAAKKRVSYALEKLHRYFSKHGVNSTTALIAGTISTNSLQAAPVGLAKTISAVAIAKGATAGGSTLTLVKGALKIMAWTKMKMAVLVGVAAIVAVSTTTVVVKRVIEARMDDSSIADSFFNSTNLWRAPKDVLILRRTHFAVNRNAAMEITGNGNAMIETRTKAGGKQEVRMVGRNQPVAQIFEMAYGLTETETRIVLPADLPQENFDYLITLPGSNEDQLKALQLEIKKKLGLVGNFEMRETNVLLLKLITPGVTGLKPHPANGYAGVTVIAGQIHAVGQSTAYLATTLEYALKLPVLDQTGFIGKNYDYVLEEGFFDGTSDSETVKKFIRDEFGLELVPSREPVEMLVVEKVK
jgi:uncharacterized protein (TIGR03435 family)